eukprot:147451-Prymnesium_polylepis.2
MLYSSGAHDPYVDIPKTATKEDTGRIDWPELKFVTWSVKGGTSYIPSARPLMGYIPKAILEKYNLKSCCLRSVTECAGQECDQRPKKPTVDRKREREESRSEAIESELKKLESQMQSSLCYAYTVGQCTLTREQCAVGGGRHKSMAWSKRNVRCHSAVDSRHYCMFASDTCPYYDHVDRAPPTPPSS